MALTTPPGLRQRKPSGSAKPSDNADTIHVVDDRDEKQHLNDARDEVVWGKTPSGEGTWQDGETL